MRFPISVFGFLSDFGLRYSDFRFTHWLTRNSSKSPSATLTPLPSKTPCVHSFTSVLPVNRTLSEGGGIKICRTDLLIRDRNIPGPIANAARAKERIG